MRKSNKKISKTEFLNRINKIQTKNYEIIGEYIGTAYPLLIKDKYGECLMLPSNLLQSKNTSIKSAINKTEYFINQAREIHGKTYDYSKFNYIKACEKSIITCSIHGDFEQTPNGHLAGKGCIKCALEITGGHSKTDFIKASKGRECTFYIIRLFNEEESFYKVGITSNTLSVRFHSTRIPYKYEIIKEIKSLNCDEIWELELKNKRLLKEFIYKPKLYFSGHTECFSDVNLLLKRT